MAMVSSSPSLSPLFFSSSKTHHFFCYRLFKNNPFIHNMHHHFGASLTFASGQKPLGPSRSGAAIEVTKAQASPSERQPMVAPYNVLITGSTKGTLTCFDPLVTVFEVLLNSNS